MRIIRKLRRWRWVLVNFRNYPKELNRRVEVENELLMAASGKAPLPDREKCRELAMRLGVPDCWRKND